MFLCVVTGTYVSHNNALAGGASKFEEASP